MNIRPITFYKTFLQNCLALWNSILQFFLSCTIKIPSNLVKFATLILLFFSEWKDGRRIKRKNLISAGVDESAVAILEDQKVSALFLFKIWTCQLLNKAPCQGKSCQFMSYTRANKTCQGKTCQGKLGRLCEALSQGKRVQLYTRAIKTCQGKLF